MGTGYTRNDTANNIADGNVINASDLDGEFDAVQAAFNASTGHSHDGTTGEGPQIDASGIANNAVALGTKTTGNYVAAGAVSGTGLSGSASAEGATFTVTSNATDANTGSTIVARDASGNFSAGTITAALTGNVTGNVSGTAGSATGNAATATALETARNIGGVSFDGTGNINLPGVNTAGNQDTSGNAATATALETARTIAGQSFDGTGNITIASSNLSDGSDLLKNVVEDTTPQLGGDLDLNSNNITGTGNIPAANLTGTLPAIDGSNLTGITSGVTVQDEGSALSTAGTTLNFTGNGVTASGTGATKTINIPGGSAPAIPGTENTALGTNALSSAESTANYNTAVGYAALEDLTTADYNTALGNKAGTEITTGSFNTAIGSNALDSATDPSFATAVGSQALQGLNSSGTGVTGIGYAAFQSGTGFIYSTAVGYDAGQLQSGSFNTVFGALAMQGTSGTAASGHTGRYNTAVGYQSLEDLITADHNTAVGNFSLPNVTSGDDNTAVGSQALVEVTTNTHNTAVGHQALKNCAAGSGTAGDQNTSLGAFAGDSVTTGENLTIIGYDADASSATAANEITLGNSSVATLRCQVTSISSLSDKRDKKNIEPLDAGIDFVKGLKPVAFDWNMRDGGKVDIADTGFIAQDLQQVQQDTGITIPYLVSDNNPDKLEAGYSKLLPVLVKAIQEQQQTIEALEARIAALEAGN